MKKYMKPQMVVVELKHTPQLLAGSEPERVYNYYSDEEQL